MFRAKAKQCLGNANTGRFATSLPLFAFGGTPSPSFGFVELLGPFLVGQARALGLTDVISKPQPLLGRFLSFLFGGCLLISCTGSTDPTPVSLLISCTPAISCFLLSSTGKFSCKYGEVHNSVPGSSLICTGKFATRVRGSSSRIVAFPQRNLDKRTGKFTQKRSREFSGVRGSSHIPSIEAVVRGSSHWPNEQLLGVRGSSPS